MALVVDYDTIFNAMLTDWANQWPDADVSQGSMIYMQSAVHASALWGLYNKLGWAIKQGFVDTADTEYIDHAGALYLLPRNSGESNESYVARILDRMRNPPAGGNANDYKVWAQSIADIKACYVFPLAQGLGTVDIVPLADETVTPFSEVPTAGKITEIESYINTVRPVTAHTFRVQTVNITTQAVTLTTTGTGFTDAEVEADIAAFMNTLEPKQTLYVSKLESIAIAAGATSATVTVPAADVVPAANEDMIRPGTITCNP